VNPPAGTRRAAYHPMPSVIIADLEPIPGIYRCQRCGALGPAIPDPAKDYAETFGPRAPGLVTSICETCWRIITAAYPPAHLEEDMLAGLPPKTIPLPPVRPPE